MQNATELIKDLKQAGAKAYLVGGCVRDTVLGHKPKDFDIATSMPIDGVVALFKDKHNVVPVGKEFGVVRVFVQGIDYQIATFRKDGTYKDGRRPESVEFTDDVKEDASRRDFTINAMYMDPETGEILDFFGGKDHLSRGLLKTVGDPYARFQEDKLRMLRAVRFSTRFGFGIHDYVVDAIHDLSPKLTQVSGERIQDELRQILGSKERVSALQALGHLGLLRYIFPELSKMYSAHKSPALFTSYKPEEWVMLCSSLDRCQNFGPKSLAQIVGLLYSHVPVGYLYQDSILDDLKFNYEEHFVVKQCAELKIPHDRKSYEAHRFFGGLFVIEVIETLAARSENPAKTKLEWLEDFMWHCHKAPLKLRDRPIVTGKLLVDYGMKPSEEFGSILAKAAKAQFEGELNECNKFEWLRKEIATRAGI